MTAIVCDSAWQCWDDPALAPLRELVLCFHGDLQRELAIGAFRGAHLLRQGAEGVVSTPGTLYLTSRRVAFLPHDAFPHAQVVQGLYHRFRLISGTAAGPIATIASDSGAVSFRFPSARELFRCFGVLRALCESARAGDAAFSRTVAQLIGAAERDEAPFTSIEVELSECAAAPELARGSARAALSDGEGIADRGSSPRFDIHFKLRALLALALASFCLSFAPLLPLAALAISLIVLYNAWAVIDKGPARAEAGARGLRLFCDEWLRWRDTRKTYALLIASLAVFLGWVVLPARAYAVLCGAALAAFVAGPVARTGALRRVAEGFWYCT